MLTIIKHVLLYGSLIWVSSCASINSKVGEALNLDTDLKLKFQVDSDINLDEQNKPSPLFVRMYELKSEKLFDRADFIELYERDEQVLAADLLRKQELKRLKPGGDRIERFVLDKQTRYVALYAEFFRYKDSKYKIVFPVTASNVIRNSIRVNISGNTIELLEH